MLIKTAYALRFLHRDEAGQGLVEYLLIFVFVALGAVAGVSSLATRVNSAFTEMGFLVSQYIS